MSTPTICLRCAKSSCKESKNGTLEICEHGVAYYNDNGKILLKDALVPLSLVTRNLRHELNRMLAVIVAESIRLDPTVTTRHIVPDNPVSKIVGTTIIIDHFVQMLSGVNQFHTTTAGAQQYEPVRLSETIKKYFTIHSIIRNEQRATELELRLNFGDDVLISEYGDVFEYLTSILMDNVWKYSFSGSTVEVSVVEREKSLADICFTNISSPLPEGIEIFTKGTQANSEAEGFGYGLFWGRVLADHYNRLRKSSFDIMEVAHVERFISRGVAEQKFILQNMLIQHE